MATPSASSDTASEKLPADRLGHASWQSPDNTRPPSLAHGPTLHNFATIDPTPQPHRSGPDPAFSFTSSAGAAILKDYESDYVDSLTSKSAEHVVLSMPYHRMNMGPRPKTRKLTSKEDANYQCEVKGCGKQFSRSYNYKAHLETHDEDREYPFLCTVVDCDRKFVRKTDLTRHHQNVHMREKNHRCDYCNRSFARKDTLRRHMEDGCSKRFDIGTLDVRSEGYNSASLGPGLPATDIVAASEGTCRLPAFQPFTKNDVVNRKEGEAPNSAMPKYPLGENIALSYESLTSLPTHMTATQWEDEGTLCYQVEVRGIVVARREDNRMINGTTLLKVAGVSDARRDVMLAEEPRHVVEDGPMHFRGVWIPLWRALLFATQNNVTDLLSPLFAQNIEIPPVNQAISVTTNHNPEERNQNKAKSQGVNVKAVDNVHSITESDIAQSGPHHAHPSAGAENDIDVDEIYSYVDPDLRPRLPTRVDSTLGESSRLFEYNLGEENLEHTTDVFTKEASKVKVSRKPRFEEGSLSSFVQRKRVAALSNSASPSCTDEYSDYQDVLVEPSEEEDGIATTAFGLSPSQRSPQTDSESSSESSFGLLTRYERKEFLLDRLMSYFFKLFASCRSSVSNTEAAAGSDGVCFAGTGGISGNSRKISNDAKGKSNAQDRGAGGGQKRSFEKDDDNDDDANERDRKKPGKITRVDGVKRTTGRKLACPYFKNNPEHPRLARSCSGPGWDTVHRIKEHLDRNHALPPSCDRCYTAFKTDADRTAHLRLETQCPLKERPSRMQGFDGFQKDQLKSRPKGYKQKSEIEKWRHIYKILFPEAEEADIPSAFYDYKSFKDSGHPIDLMNKYEDFLGREMPDRVRHQLELRIERALDPIEQQLQSQIVDIACDIQMDLFKSFLTSIGTDVTSTESSQRAEVIRNSSTPGQTRPPTSKPLVAEEQVSWIQALPIGELPMMDIDDVPFCFAFPQDFDGVRFDLGSFEDELLAQDSTSGTSSISLAEVDQDQFPSCTTSTDQQESVQL
ncbi:hypothetical protein PFICI_04978 [Pestalotiopsis fici W106-1]|uniref:Uncharacterized protein n=1 Tax=Pestalotiopsis fici (strain W106-1 / CGMCC3.15140) TaxID=1229662 RepID=W3XCC8_PESFW|nr:uncharacterized protein PFICI_04978 [Pestalotiopsis fici W106-1]ETS83102.1 hypothetical protein PFICI_04978 [Pestalotiopsis fici W106-1]